MARMIPATIDPDVKSNAERRIFDWFSRLDMKDAIVLHSLGLAHHRNNVFGEIDFVLLSPEGILCVEVKGGRVERIGGEWKFIDRFGNTASRKKGPFEQVLGNMHSLRDYFIKNQGENQPLSKCQYACCVMMPDCVFGNTGPDIIGEVLLDTRIGESGFKKFILDSYGYWRNACREKHGFEGGFLSGNHIDLAAMRLRGDFRFVPPLDVELSRSEDNLLQLTEEQYMALENLSDNRCMLIEGAAGTGKTLLAEEYARRKACDGKRVLFLCYNRQISDSVRRDLASDRTGNILVSTFHSYLEEKCGKDLFAIRNDDYYRYHLPQRYIDLLSAENGFQREFFDTIVVDEGQDLLKTEFLMCIDMMISGGLQNGEWVILYDINQSLFDSTDNTRNMLNELKAVYGPVSYRLSLNCRNTKQIAGTNRLYTNIPQAKIAKANGMDAEYHPFGSRQEEFDMIVKTVRKLLSAGISVQDIVLLSPYSFGNPKNGMSCGVIPADLGQLVYNPSIQEVSDRKRRLLKLYTIQSYKGLESKVVLLLDIDGFHSDEDRLRNYVGISRASALLHIFYSNDCENEKQGMLISSAAMIV